MTRFPAERQRTIRNALLHDENSRRYHSALGFFARHKEYHDVDCPQSRRLTSPARRMNPRPRRPYSPPNRLPICHVDHYLRSTVSYATNPNGSPVDIAGLRSTDGRVLVIMPCPKRCVLNSRSWVPPGAVDEEADYGLWVHVFQIARW